MKYVDNKPVFTLTDMIDCWETAQDSWAKECGADMEEIEDEEDGYDVPTNKKEYFKLTFGININAE